MRTEHAFVPKREIADEFCGFDSTMLRKQPQIDNRKRVLEWDLVPDRLPQILSRTTLAQQLLAAVSLLNITSGQSLVFFARVHPRSMI